MEGHGFRIPRCRPKPEQCFLPGPVFPQNAYVFPQKNVLPPKNRKTDWPPQKKSPYSAAPRVPAALGRPCCDNDVPRVVCSFRDVVLPFKPRRAGAVLLWDEDADCCQQPNGGQTTPQPSLSTSVSMPIERSWSSLSTSETSNSSSGEHETAGQLVEHRNGQDTEDGGEDLFRH